MGRERRSGLALRLMDGFAYSPITSELDTFGVEDTFQIVGMASPAFVEAVYPYRELTEWHRLNHIPGLTGRWMDRGATELGGAVRGSYHRLAHGHHLIEDGLKVIRVPELKFGEFLHHLGLDSLTRRGVPNPFIPKILVEKLIETGLPVSTVSEWASINVPKLLGGGLALVVSGNDVVMAFSDAIPHTWSAVGKHFAFGVLDTVFGVVSENPLLLVGAAGEFFASGVTAWRVLMDPVVEHCDYGSLGGFFVPALGDAIGLGPVLSGCSALMAGAPLGQAADAAISATAAATAATYAKMAKTGLILGLPVAGLAAGLIARRLLRSLDPKPGTVNYQIAPPFVMSGQATLMPMLALPVAER